MKKQIKFLGLLMMIPAFFLFQSCNTEEDTVEPIPNEIIFEEGIKGIWQGHEYYAEYFNEEGNLIFTENMDVFIEEIEMDGEKIIYRYIDPSPDWTSDYAPQIREGENYIVTFMPPDVHVTELTGNLMTWKMTTHGGVFDDDMGNIQVQADHKIRTLKFHR